MQPCIIADCGEHKDGDSWGAAPSDGTGDAHPVFPEDSDIDFKDVSISAVFDLQGLGLADNCSARSTVAFFKYACLLAHPEPYENVDLKKNAISQIQVMFSLVNNGSRGKSVPCNNESDYY